ncbi:MAG: pyridoxal phosphate-dependent aminotransferase [Bacteroidales bacterium]|nr:pyridoxal phosphate-dependent aminotransferase [Bacteroidales bacterium]
MNALSDRINLLSESETLAMTRKSRELKAKGYDVINLSIGEPDFNTPEFIKDAAREAIDQNKTHYPPVSGYPELREAIAAKFKRDNGLDYTAEQIVVSGGAKHSIANAMLCLVNKGDEVIVPAPYWVSYKEIIKLAEGVPVVIEALIENDFKFTPGQLEAAISPKSKVLIYSSPCNPTGSVYSREELKDIAAVIAAHPNLYVISDEIYELIRFEGKHESIAQFQEIKDRVITINGVSKGFAMTGWRVGFLAATPEIAKACDKLQGQITSATSSISQYASLAAVKCDPSKNEEIREMVDTFRERRDLVHALLEEIPGFRNNMPLGAFYFFPDISEYFGKKFGEQLINNSTDLCMYLLNHAHVALVPGDAFGDPNCIRISYATSKKLLITAMARISDALAELK